MNELVQTARSLGIDIIGGHTEVTDSVTRTVVSVTMIGKPVVKGKMFKTSDVQPGDDIIMTKYAGLEGTAIIASDFSGELSLTEQERKELARIKESLSVVKDGRIAAETDGIHAMHDITEGGVLGAVCELSLIHISEPTRQAEISYAVFCLKKKNTTTGRVIQLSLSRTYV